MIIYINVAHVYIYIPSDLEITRGLYSITEEILFRYNLFLYLCLLNRTNDERGFKLLGAKLPVICYMLIDCRWECFRGLILTRILYYLLCQFHVDVSVHLRIFFLIMLNWFYKCIDVCINCNQYLPQYRGAHLHPLMERRSSAWIDAKPLSAQIERPLSHY